METMHDSAETSVGDYLNVLRRRWLVVLGTTVVAIAVMAFIDLRATPVYQASTQLLLQPTQSESIFQPGAVQVDPGRAIQNELKVINSLRVRNAVREAYGGPVSINAASGGEDDVIILSATDTNPEEAARKVNVYAETYQEVRLNGIVSELAQSKEVLQQQVDDFQTEIDALNAPIAELDEQIIDTPPESEEYAQLVIERERLNNSIQAERNELESQLADYQQRLQVLQLSERLTTTGGVQILNPASVPSAPVSPTLARDLLQAALIGFFVGIALALLLEQIDDSIRSSSDLERAVKEVPVLGLIPIDDGWKGKDQARVSTREGPMSATAEAYRGLRTTIQYLGLHRPMGVVQVTSASASEGKTSTVANLAYAFAEAGMPVAVVGCDLRRPRTHNFLHVDGAVGLTSVLLGDHTLDQALQQSPLHPNIRVLPSGPLPPNPSELLSLDRTSDLIRSLLADHAIVFLDCPPVLPVTDSLVLSRTVDASIFVARANGTSKRQAKRAVDRLHQVDSPLVGTILNGVNAESAYGSLYDYYGYSQPSRLPVVGRFLKRSRRDLPATDSIALPPTGGRPNGDQPGPGPAPGSPPPTGPMVHPPSGTAEPMPPEPVPPALNGHANGRPNGSTPPEYVGPGEPVGHGSAPAANGDQWHGFRDVDDPAERR